MGDRGDPAARREEGGREIPVPGGRGMRRGRIPLSREQRDAGDSRCPLQRGAGDGGALTGRRAPAVRGRGIPLPGLGGMRDAGAGRSGAAARGRSGRSCCFPRVPSPGKGSAPRAPAPDAMTEDAEVQEP